jgi:DNA invertase Pin-like site-specific DNA recombinase
VWIWGKHGLSTSRQDLDRQVDAMQAVGIDPAQIYLDKKSGSTVERPGLRAVTGYARAGDVIVVHTLDRLGRTVRDTLNLIHELAELAERGVGVRNLADPIKVDSANPADPMAQLAVVLLALLAQMERTYMLERAAHARAVGRPHVRWVLLSGPGSDIPIRSREPFAPVRRVPVTVSSTQWGGCLGIIPKEGTERGHGISSGCVDSSSDGPLTWPQSRIEHRLW